MATPASSANPAKLIWRVGGRKLDLSRAGMVMGIVNVTPDSFSDGGQFLASEAAIAHGLRLESEGAQILDVGGESTRPGAAEVGSTEERERVLPVLGGLRKRCASETLLSVDTSKPEVAAAALALGTDIVNDINGLRGEGMLELAADCEAGLVVMHMQGVPRTMQHKPHYTDVVAEVRAFFEERLAACERAGIDPQRLCFDPGIGFGKTLEHNLALLRNLDALTVANRPTLIGTSRKSFIGAILGSKDLEHRAAPSVALTALASEAGVRIHRVHDVLPNVHALRMAEAIAG